ncbi:MAG: pilus assembly protein PilB [Marinobacter sp.]|uniref:pilus assembly protein PilB n=1 Tax=Marinobacter sp. TaxID=50741 RepID=UPI00299D690A|nr:pilus assembly protein PilB [Marinobacter sp.]MDX1755584.1 pilus assembly protein PilB [Marinobacter sp.]
MKISHGLQEKSRLGRLLINRGYLTEAQLEVGLKRHQETGQRLGEFLVQSGWISEKELGRVLKHQARYRNAAALVTMITLPFQPLVSFAASSPGTGGAENTVAGELYADGNWTPMTDAELAQAVGRATDDFLAQVVRVEGMAEAASDSDGEPLGEEATDAVEGLKLIARTFVPALNFVNSEMTISGVHYREGVSRFRIHEDGALELSLPERIERVDMRNIRVSEGNGPILGHVTLSDIQFQAGSRITISTRR